MAITLPGYLADVFGMVGLPWPDINEDDLHTFAGTLRSFATDLRDHRESVTSTLTDVGGKITSQAYLSLAENWANTSKSHMEDAFTILEDMATGLDDVADVVVVVKEAVIAAFVAMAAETAADAAASIMTLGLAAAAEPAIIEGTRLIVKNLLQRIEQEVITKVATHVFGGLIDDLESRLDALVYAGVTQVLA